MLIKAVLYNCYTCYDIIKWFSRCTLVHISVHENYFSVTKFVLVCMKKNLKFTLDILELQMKSKKKI